jgi:hypothetical protein
LKLYQFAEISKPVVMMANTSKPMSFNKLAVKFVGVCHFVSSLGKPLQGAAVWVDIGANLRLMQALFALSSRLPKT